MTEIGIVTFLPGTKRGFLPTVPVGKIVNAILSGLKTGLPRDQLTAEVHFTRTTGPGYVEVTRPGLTF